MNIEDGRPTWKNMGEITEYFRLTQHEAECFRHHLAATGVPQEAAARRLLVEYTIWRPAFDAMVKRGPVNTSHLRHT